MGRKKKTATKPADPLKALDSIPTTVASAPSPTMGEPSTASRKPEASPSAPKPYEDKAPRPSAPPSRSIERKGPSSRPSSPIEPATAKRYERHTQAIRAGAIVTSTVLSPTMVRVYNGNLLAVFVPSLGRNIIFDRESFEAAYAKREGVDQ
jgi:hypothetical protein